MNRAIAGAELTVVNDGHVTARVASDAAGRFVFDGLPSGRLVVDIAAPGYVGVKPVVDLYRDVEADFALIPQ